jgi:hypothetical protein
MITGGYLVPDREGVVGLPQLARAIQQHRVPERARRCGPMEIDAPVSGTAIAALSNRRITQSRQRHPPMPIPIA